MEADWFGSHPHSVFQQAISAVSTTSERLCNDPPHSGGVLMTISITDADCYELGTGCYAVYGFDYKPGFAADNGVCIFSPALLDLEVQRLMRCLLSRAVYYLDQ